MTTERSFASSRFVGAFEFADVVNAVSDDALAELRTWGVDTLMTEGDAYRAETINRVHAAGMGFFAGLSVFSDPAGGNALLEARPELHPIDETGRRRPQIEWYVGITPSIADYRERRSEAAERIARDYDVDGIMLDFVRWPLHWEIELRPGAPRPLMSSFDPVTLADFASRSGRPLPSGLDDPAAAAQWILAEARDSWTAYRCNVVTEFVEDVARRVRSVRPEITLGAFVVPLAPDPLAEAVGQDVRALGRVVDFLAPMTYHAIVHHDPDWVRAITESIAASAACPVAPVVQVDSADGPARGADWGPPVPVEEWATVVRNARAARGATGLIAFPAGALSRDGRGRRLSQATGGYRMTRVAKLTYRSLADQAAGPSPRTSSRSA